MAPLESRGRYRVRRKSDGQYLVAPIDGWGKGTPAWTPIPEAAFRFGERAAQQQCDFLGWFPHRIKALKTRSMKMATVTSPVADATGA